ncbi:MAG: hypothetical protein A3F14_03060 [Gammaproteobacteria bacterium RIFCSPHIGHO2_12_FULL_43_28]|nr:MAG: hypothetical protein A3F14_03060 [Gammaproteobacteria bacterium RIFCSPHIGHO2_12_FULL_43_28]
MPPPPPSGSQSDNSSAILWTVAAVFATVGAVWFFFKNYIVIAFLSVKLIEAKLLSVFNEPYFTNLQAVIHAAIASPAKVDINLLTAIGSGVGNWLRIPFVILLLALAFLVYVNNTTRVFKRIYSTKALAKLECDSWPQIAPVVDLDLIDVDIDKGPWAMALSPVRFCKKYKLLEEVRPERHEGMTRRDWDRIEVVLKRGEANKLFAMQLGPVWQGVNRLPPHIRALFAAFAARFNADGKAASALLFQLNASSRGKLDFSGVDDLLKKYKDSPRVKQITESHAYVTTVMASMLEGAREDGVQASADFLWLKPLDRRLWYTLNVVGRQTPFAEVAGIFAHWVAEKEAGQKLMTPMITEATNALDLALKEVIYRPDED